MKKFFLLFVFATNANLLMSQACFKVSPLKGCAPMTVKIRNCSSASPQFYIYGDEGSGADTTFTFKTPGIKRIIQFVGGSGTLSDTLFVEVLAATNPDFDVFLCQNNGASVQITQAGNYDVFFVDFGQGRDTISASQTAYFFYPLSGTQSIEIQGNYLDKEGNFGSISCGKTRKSFQTVSTLSALQIQEIKSIKDSLYLQTQNQTNVLSFLQEKQADGSAADIERNRATSLTVVGNRPRCFRLALRDNCSADDVSGNWLCSMELRAEAKQEFVELNWPQYPESGFVRYNLYRDGKLVYASNNISQLRFQDADVQCLKTYCYDLEVITSFAKVFTDKVCVVANSAEKPALPTLAAASVLSDTELEISWRVPTGAAIAQTLISGNTTAQTTANRFQVSNLTTQTNSFCFLLRLLDSCGNRSTDSVRVCSVLLSNSKSGRDNVLVWSTFEGFEGNYSYTLQVFDGQDNLLREIGPLQSETYTDAASAFTSKLQVYRIKAQSTQDPSRFAYSNSIQVLERHNIQIPTAFTPNGDGLNDVLLAYSATTASVEMSVFNRWGERLFVSNSLTQGWDGTYNGQNAPAGVYTVQLLGKDVFGESFQLSEKVQLIR